MTSVDGRPAEPVSAHLVVAVESLAIGVTSADQPLPPAVGVTLHALDAETKEPIVIELALQQDTAISLLSEVSQTLVEIHGSCDDMTCVIHHWQADD